MSGAPAPGQGRLKVLYLSPRQAWPPRSGAKLRDYHLARCLGGRADLTYIYFPEPGLSLPGSQDLSFCRRLIAVPRPRAYTPAKIVRGILGRWPLPVVNYTSPEMTAVVKGLLEHERFDIVQVESIHLAACLSSLGPELDATRVVYNWHNIESEAMERYSHLVNERFRKLYARTTARKLFSAETSILQAAFGHLVCSERERALLAARAPQARIEVVENGVDVKAFEEAEGTVGPRCRVVFVGQMDYHANVEAAVFFARKIWPRVRERFPRWILTVVGSNPVSEVAALAKEQAIEVTGTVPDVRRYYHEAVAAVVPLHVGGGTRLKILEAMAAGVPVVSTPLGAEGLTVSNGKNILLIEQDDQWLHAFESLEGGGSRWEDLVRSGRKLVKSGYDWEVLGQKLYEIYDRWKNLAQ